MAHYDPRGKCHWILGALEDGPRTWPDLTREAAFALAHPMAAGVRCMHRTLRRDGLIRSRRGEVRITDLGRQALAALRAGRPWVTPRYIPEQKDAA